MRDFVYICADCGNELDGTSEDYCCEGRVQVRYKKIKSRKEAKEDPMFDLLSEKRRKTWEELFA